MDNIPRLPCLLYIISTSSNFTIYTASYPTPKPPPSSRSPISSPEMSLHCHRHSPKHEKIDDEQSSLKERGKILEDFFQELLSSLLPLAVVRLSRKQGGRLQQEKNNNDPALDSQVSGNTDTDLTKYGNNTCQNKYFVVV